MKDKISILCATDDNYVPYCGIMLSSVFINHPKGVVDAYIMVKKPLAQRNARRFEKLANRYSNAIHFVYVDDSLLKTVPINGMDYWTTATYYRLYASHLLPESVHKVLYLDCDIIVNGDISSLWKMNWDGLAVGVVPDIFNDADKNYSLLSYEKKLGYFNAGVVFMNLDYWRKYALGEVCLKYLESHFRILQSNDQDVLNYVLKDCKRTLPLTYNFQVQFFSRYFRTEVFSESFVNEIVSVSNPLVVHYAAPVKPWMIEYYRMPYGKLWQSYKRRSQWRFLQVKLSKDNKIKAIIKRFLLWPLDIKRPVDVYVDNIKN